MSPAVLPFVLMGFFLLVVGGVVWLVAAMTKRAADNVQTLAAALGLNFVAKPPTLGLFYAEPRAAGQIRERAVEIHPFATGTGKSRVQWCTVAAATTSSLTFHLQRQGFGSKLMELFGAREIQVGDPEFDAAWFIQTNRPAVLAAALLPELRARMMALHHAAGQQARGVEFKLDAGAVRYAEVGSFANADTCDRCGNAASLVCDLAEAVEAADDAGR